MEEITEITSSEEAIKVFKTQIGECLPLLGLMTADDKENVWRFWKTISAAVKIAVNGKGNIVQPPKRQRKGPTALDADMEEDRLQKLDRDVISMYIPVKSVNTSVLKYRVLKFDDHKKIADYLEEVWPKGVDNVNSEKPQNDERVSNTTATTISSLTGEELQSDIPELISDSVKDASDQGLKTVVKYLQEVCPKPVVLSVSSHNEKDRSPSPFPKDQKSQVTAKKIYPVSRPITRSQSTVTNIEKNKDSPPASTGLSAKTTNTLASKSENNVASVALYAGTSAEEPRANLEEGFNITVVPINSSSVGKVQLNVTTELQNSDPHDSQRGIQTQKESDVISHEPAGNFEPETAFEVHASSSPWRNDESLEGHTTESALQYVDTDSPIKEPSQSMTQPRSTSDIETIISALEEELKKTGKGISGVSVSTASKPSASEASLLIQHCQSSHTSCASSAAVEHTSYPCSTSNAPDSTCPPLSTTPSLDTDSAKGSDQNIETSSSLQQEDLDVQSESIPTSDLMVEAGQPIQVHGSHHLPTYLDESGQPVKLHPTPVQITAYIDETGQPIQSNPGQVTAIQMDESGQPMQILQGQEIVEVEGSIENIIWACDGEVQILQQQPQQQEGVDHELSCVTQNNGMEPDQSLLEPQPVQAHYDVVEYEVLSDKRQKRGRKRKVRPESEDRADASPGKMPKHDNPNSESSDVLDRTCPICHRVLNYASSMKAHMRIHTGARPYSCGQCDRSFTTKANRDRHEATHVGLKPFKCEECHKSFTEKRSLKIHMRSHTGERPYVCEICGQGFAQNCTLQVHKVLHTDRRAHLCDLCGKAFRQKNQLEVHVKRHNRQAAYPCQHCPTQCYTRGDLVRHMIKHTGERPYTCKLCPRAFTRKQYLIDHENQHYDRKPYSCSKCGMAFHDMGSCHRHLRKHKQNAKEESNEADARTPSSLPVLSSEVVQKMLGNAKPGQVIKLEDGTDAIVKQVTNEADGSTVYHITCLNMVNVSNNNSVSLVHSADPSQTHGMASEIKVEVSGNCSTSQEDSTEGV